MKWISRNIELIIASLGFSAVIIYSISYKMESNIFLGLLGTVATLYFGSIKYRIENDRLFKELFTGFNLKYDQKLNDLLNSLKYDTTYALNHEEKNLIIDYFNLCSEEYLWRRKNRIPKMVWNAWKAGIKENLSIKQVREIYETETSSPNGEDSFYGLVEELKE